MRKDPLSNQGFFMAKPITAIPLICILTMIDIGLLCFPFVQFSSYCLIVWLIASAKHCGQVFIVVLLGDRSGRWLQAWIWGRTATKETNLRLNQLKVESTLCVLQCNRLKLLFFAVFLTANDKWEEKSTCNSAIMVNLSTSFMQFFSFNSPTNTFHWHPLTNIFHWHPLINIFHWAHTLKYFLLPISVLRCSNQSIDSVCR